VGKKVSVHVRDGESDVRPGQELDSADVRLHRVLKIDFDSILA
jgi:hypothetical protein